MSGVARRRWLSRRRELPTPAGEAIGGRRDATLLMPAQRRTADRPVSRYASFKVLLDDPDDHPGLGFDGYADAITEIITHSRAEFAVGVFGRWGSGKTTLMRAIARRLAADKKIVPVWFAAWRYEKEPNLILPLIDLLREALENEDTNPASLPRKAATLVGQAGQAFLQGLQLSANLPGVSATFTPGQMIEEIKAGRNGPAALSLYHEGFQMLSEAIEGLSAGGKRVVIFIDDLDRCMPANALDVLESMKVFFDVEGCVFVVGLDQDIAEKAVAVKYRTGQGMTVEVDGRDYLKKLFQVPFTLPSVGAQHFKGYLDTLERNSNFSETQLRDYKRNVRRHFSRLQGIDPVNPREIKRLINMYTLQLKILSTRLGDSIKPNVVLSLLCMNTRSDWQAFYHQLAADPQYFQSALTEALTESRWPESVWLAGTSYTLPRDLVRYLRGDGAGLLTVRNLGEYVLAAESTWTTDPWVLDARIVVGHLRRAGDELLRREVTQADALRRIIGDVDRLYSLIGTRRESSGQLGAIRERLDAAASKLMSIVRDAAVDSELHDDTFRGRWKDKALPQVDAIDAELLEWHRYLALGS
jgi:KAP family P-loop domain